MRKTGAARHLLIALALAASSAAGVSHATTAVSNPQSLIDRATGLIESGDHSLARTYLEPALISPRLSSEMRARAYYLRGYAFLADGLEVSAAKDFYRALAFHPEHPGALGALAQLMAEGRGIDANPQQALALHSLAADKGQALSVLYVAQALLNDRLVERDVPRAQQMLRELVAALETTGDQALPVYGRALTWLGQSFREGYAEVPAPDQALAWYQRAAQAGDATALLAMGHMAERGESPTLSRDDAVSYYRQALAAGNARAGLRLGFLFVTQDDGDNAAEGRALLETAAQAGLVEAHGGLAYAFENGIGGAPDAEQALAHYREAAHHSDAYAQLRMAYFHLQESEPPDYERAADWLAKAAAHDLPQAHNDYAWLLATAPSAALRDGVLAVQHAEIAVELDASAQHLDTLAAAWAERGDFEQARQYQHDAIAAATAAANPSLVAELESRLDHYASERPWREQMK